MQMDATDAFDISQERKRSQNVWRRHASATDVDRTSLVERGVRFVQIWHGAGQPWDSHEDLDVECEPFPRMQSTIGALLKD